MNKHSPVKNLTAWILTLVLLLGMMPVVSLPALAASTGAKIDMSDSNPKASGEGWTYSDYVYTILNGADVTITGSNGGGSRRVAVADNAMVTVRLAGTTINVSGVDGAAALYIGKDAAVRLLVEDLGLCALRSGSGRAGIEVPAGASLSIYGDGRLDVYGGVASAGIGAAEGGDCGKISIYGGAITANAGADRVIKGWAPEPGLGQILYDAGFLYDPDGDVLFARKNANQYALGYTYFYDEGIPLVSSNITAEPVYFYYDNKEWMIEIWKGQYGVETGAEIGVYNRELNGGVMRDRLSNNYHALTQEIISFISEVTDIPETVMKPLRDAANAVGFNAFYSAIEKAEEAAWYLYLGDEVSWRNLQKAIGTVLMGLNGKMYDVVSEEEMLRMSYTLKDGSDELFSRNTWEAWDSYTDKHWWLTGFEWGNYTNKPHDLTMEITIWFPTYNMRNAFIFDNLVNGLAGDMTDAQIQAFVDKDNALLDRTPFGFHGGFTFQNNDYNPTGRHRGLANMEVSNYGTIGYEAISTALQPYDVQLEPGQYAVIGDYSMIDSDGFPRDQHGYPMKFVVQQPMAKQPLFNDWVVGTVNDANRSIVNTYNRLKESVNCETNDPNELHSLLSNNSEYQDLIETMKGIVSPAFNVAKAAVAPQSVRWPATKTGDTIIPSVGIGGNGGEFSLHGGFVTAIGETAIDTDTFTRLVESGQWSGSEFLNGSAAETGSITALDASSLYRYKYIVMNTPFVSMPAISANPAVIDYGTMGVGYYIGPSSLIKTIRIQNDSDAPVTLIQPAELETFYTWRLNKTTLAAAGAGEDSWVDFSVGLPSGVPEGVYTETLVFTTDEGAAVSVTVKLTVIPATSLNVVTPQNVTVVEGNITESIVMEQPYTTSTQPLQYQWRSMTHHNGNGTNTAIPGATELNYKLPTTLTSEGSPYYFRCRVTSADGPTKDTQTVTVTVAPKSAGKPKIISLQTADQDGAAVQTKIQDALDTAKPGDRILVGGKTSISGMAQNVVLDIPEGVTLLWAADLYIGDAYPHGLSVNGKGTFETLGGDFVAVSTRFLETGAIRFGGSVTARVTGGQIRSFAPKGIVFASSGTLTISGGTIQNEYTRNADSAAITASAGSILITGGTLTAVSREYDGYRIMQLSGSATANITGGFLLGYAPEMITGENITVSSPATVVRQDTAGSKRYAEGSSTDLHHFAGSAPATWHNTGTETGIRYGNDKFYFIYGIAVEPGYTITGVIQGQNEGSGAALAGAVVQLKQNGNNAGESVLTNAQGEYTIAHVLADSDYVVEASMSGYSGGTSEPFAVAGNIAAKNLLLERLSYAIALAPAADRDFGTAEVGYEQPEAHSVTATNVGGSPTGDLTIALSGDNAVSFTLSKTLISSIAVSGSDTFTVEPNSGLAAGTYTATVMVSGENITTQSFAVSFTVNAAPAHLVTVSSEGTGASGGGSYAKNDTVHISAGTPPEGMQFKNWISNPEVAFADANSIGTSFTMPGADVKVTANFEQMPILPTVTGIVVNPPAVTVEKGKTYQFTAEVSGANDPPQSVSWRVEGGIGATAIAEDGLLTVAAEETADTLTVIAASTLDGYTAVTGTATVTVSEEAQPVATVTSVTVTPPSVTLDKGDTYTFSARVDGTNNPPQGVNWRVEGGNAGTAITAGVLTIAEDETADTLTVTATSTLADYTDVSGTAAVTVIQTAPPAVHSVTVQNDGNGTGAAAPASAAQGTQITLNATAAAGYRFKTWEIVSGAVSFSAATENPATFIMPDEAVTVKATFEPVAQTNFTITFNANGGTVSPSSATTGTDGKLVSLPTPTRTGGYAFKGWYTAASGGKAVTTDTTFTEDATIYAQWTFTGGGDNSGGGGSITPSQPTTIPAQDGAVQVTYTLSGGTASLNLPDGKLNEIITEATGTGGGQEAVFDLSEGKDIIAVQMPPAAFEKLAEAEVMVKVKLPQGAITMDADTLAAISEQAAGNVIVSITALDKTQLSTRQRAAVGDAPVFDISVQSGNDYITDFGGFVTISLPYELREGELPNGILIYYVDESGDMEKISAMYDMQTKTVIFTTNHLSKYAIAHDLIAAWSNTFSDVAEKDWFYSDIAYAVQRSLFSGTSDTTFVPQASMTRGMLVTVLGRLAGVDTAQYSGVSFSDVDATMYYAPYIQWAAELGIISGVGNNMFVPESAISRQDLCVILNRYAEKMGIDLPKENMPIVFTDAADISDYAADSVCAIQCAGIVSGKENAVFDPMGGATRAEVAAMLHRFLEVTT